MLKDCFWPISQSVDFVNASINETTSAINQELSRYTNNESGIISKNIFINDFTQLSDVFSIYTNTVTQFLVFEISTGWSFLFTNSFICDGYDSLMYNLTRIHHLETLHVSSHDETTTFLPGTQFCYRKVNEKQLIERTVQCQINDNNRWSFFEEGERQDWENVSDYSKIIKKERINEKSIELMLENIGLNIYQVQNFSFPQNGILLQRTKYPETITTKTKNEVLKRYREES